VAQDSWRIMRKLGEIVGGGASASASASPSATSVGENGGSAAVEGAEGGGGGGAGLVIDYGSDRVFGSSFRVSPVGLSTFVFRYCCIPADALRPSVITKSWISLTSPDRPT
jgi:hypothetical protein